MAKPEIHCPADSMSDEKISVRVSGLRTCRVHTIHASACFDSGFKFESFAIFQSSRTGTVNLGTDCSLGGTYLGCDQMGLFWSMKPSQENKHPYARFTKSNVTTPLPVTIKVFDAELSSWEEIKKYISGNLELQSVQLNRWFMNSTTKRIPLTVKKDGVLGTLFVPDGPGPFPGVIVMFGGQPGIIEHKASLLASHGFAALALAIFAIEVPGVSNYFSSEPIPTEYYQAAVNRLLRQDYVLQSGVGVISVSFSGSIAIAMAECCEHIKCVIWISGLIRPANRTIQSKTREIPSIDFEIDDDKTDWRGFHHTHCCDGEGTPGVMPDGFQFVFQNRPDIAYMFIAGLSDDNVPSEHYINYAEKLLKQARHPNYKILRYPGAGHLIEPPYAPHNKTTQFMNLTLLDWGGEPVPHCRSQEHSWREQLQFLRRNIPGEKTAKL